MNYLVYYLATLIPLTIIDFVWLSVIAKNLYFTKMAFLFGKSFNLIPILLFYTIYALTVLLLVVLPSIQAGNWVVALWRGAILGLAAYAAYDLTNYATISKWPLEITIIDMVWGVALTATVSVIAYFIIGALK